jgi:DNA topoisomerase-1
MKWQVMPGKEKQIKLILDELKKADALYLATDPDREGEAISWHLLEILNARGALKGKPVYRATFNEITKKAVQAAIAAPREIDRNLVDAYLVRRALDYLIGFKLSPLLWRRNLGRSAGRVQSVAVSLVVDRERDIEAFKAEEYWTLGAQCATAGGKTQFNANLSKFNGEKIDKMSIENKEKMFSILGALSEEYKDIESMLQVGALEPPMPAEVASVEKKKTTRRPAAPFTTSTLQQEAARKLHFSSKRTMAAAQRLYEQGLITYMRTDATNLSADAVSEIREFIGREYGSAFLPKSPNIYSTKSKNAQEAHEAVRPTSAANDARSSKQATDEDKLYDLIWKRTVACQMTNAEFDQVAVDIKPVPDSKIPGTIFHAVGTTRTFDGFMKVYIEDRDDSEDDHDGGAKLPPLAAGDKIDIGRLLPEQHWTQPPPRYTEASLVKKLEELGIGRPSTYAAIMSTIVDREYVRLDKQRFFPTSAGWLVSAFLGRYFADIVAVDFTAKTEDALDDVAGGATARKDALDAFWNPFSSALGASKDVPTPSVLAEINKALHAHLFPDGNDKCPECADGRMELKVSKYGPFLGCSNYPDCKYTRNELRDAGDAGADAGPKPSGGGKDLGDGIKFMVGRFGPYVQQGDGKDAKRAAAKKYDADTITLEIAKDLLSGEKQGAEPVEIGANPATGKMIYFHPDGRYGPYISSDKVNASVKEQPDLERAAELINNKKPGAKKSWGRKTAANRARRAHGKAKIAAKTKKRPASINDGIQQQL